MKTVHEFFLTRFAMFAVKQPHLGEQLEIVWCFKGMDFTLAITGHWT
jgi:hypothetical protein